MGRPRKMTTEQMISVVDSYYLARAHSNEKRLKCSLIAAYAVELGYQAEGYDFARNLEVREHIERMKCFAEAERKESPIPVYKSLDIEGFLRNNRGTTKLMKALTDLDAYWKRVYEHAEMISTKNTALMKEKSGHEMSIKESSVAHKMLSAENADLSSKNNKLIAENRYLRKMLRTYLYPAIANEILIAEDVLDDADPRASEEAIADMAEFERPLSFKEAVANDMELLSEEDLLLQKMWEKCDEEI